MRYYGPKKYHDWTLANLANLAELYRQKTGRTIRLPRSVTVYEVRSSQRSGRNFVTYRRGKPGVAWAELPDKIELVLGPNGEPNPAYGGYREPLEHECGHIVLWAAGVPVEKHHAVMNKHGIGPLVKD